MNDVLQGSDGALDALSSIIEEQTTDLETMRVALEVQCGRLAEVEGQRDRLLAVIDELVSVDVDALIANVRDRVVAGIGELNDDGEHVVALAVALTCSALNGAAATSLRVG